MASKALAVVPKGTSAVQYVDPNKVDYAVGQRWLSQQNTGGGNRMFAGRQLRFDGKKGGYSEYVNKQNKKIKNPVFVLNVPNTYAAWQYWPEGEAPSYPAVIAPFQSADAVLPSRATLGPSETKFNKLKKEEEDVYNETVVFILRNPDTDDIYHWVGAKSQKNAMVEFLQENAEEFARRKGKLPVVELGTEEIELKDGGSYEKPTITITEWVKPTAMDNPAGLAASMAADAPDDEDDDEPKMKTAVKSRSASKSKAVEPDDEDDEDEDAPSTKAAAKKNAVKRAALKKQMEEDDDEDEDEEDEDDDEDERPAKKSSKSKAVAAKPAKGRKPVDDDDDEDDDEDDDDEDDEDEDDVPVKRRGRGK